MKEAAHADGLERQRWIQVAQSWLELCGSKQRGAGLGPRSAGNDKNLIDATDGTGGLSGGARDLPTGLPAPFQGSGRDLHGVKPLAKERQYHDFVGRQLRVAALEFLSNSGFDHLHEVAGNVGVQDLGCT